MRRRTYEVTAAVLFFAVGVGHLELAGIPVLSTEVHIVSLFDIGVVYLVGVSYGILVSDLATLIPSSALSQMEMAASFSFAALIARCRSGLISSHEQEVFPLL